MEAVQDVREETIPSLATDHQSVTSDPQQVSATLASLPSVPAKILSDIENVDLSLQTSNTESITTCRTFTQDERSGTELSSATSATGTVWAFEPVIFQIQKFHVCATLPMDEVLLSVWADQILPRLNAELLHNVHIGTWLPELLLVGKRRDKLKPCVLVTCGDNGTRKQVEKLYKRLKWLREILKDKDMTFLALTRKVVLSGGSRPGQPEYRATDTKCFINISANTTTFCGQRIHISSKESQPPSYCTLGGVIRIGHRLYGLTAGHSFDIRTEARDHFDAENEFNMSSSTAASESSEGSDSPVLFDENDPDPLSSPATTDIFFEDMPPAADDLPHTSLEVFEDHSWEWGSDNLELYQVEVVLPASLNLRASNVDETVPDYDWALLEIGDMKTILPNVNTIGGAEEHVLITDLAEQTPPSQENVTVLTATLGPVTAILNPAHASLKLGSCIFNVQLIVLETNLPIGSSGSWVVQGSRLYGYIIATRQDVPWAYMMPIYHVVQDIKSAFGTDLVELPSPRNADTSLRIPSSVDIEEDCFTQQNSIILEQTSRVHPRRTLSRRQVHVTKTLERSPTTDSPQGSTHSFENAQVTRSEGRKTLAGGAESLDGVDYGLSDHSEAVPLLSTPDDDEMELLVGMGLPLVKIRPASKRMLEARGRHSRGPWRDLESVDEYATSRDYPRAEQAARRKARRRSPPPSSASSLLNWLGALRPAISLILRNRSVRKALGKYSEIGDDYDVDSVPVDLSSLAGMGLEMTVTSKNIGGDFSDQDTAYISAASASTKPHSASFVKRAPKIGYGLVIGAELKFDPTNALPDRAKSSSRRTEDSNTIQRSKKVRKVGQNLAQERNTIVAVEEKLDEGESVDISSFEGSNLTHRMSSQTLDSTIGNAPIQAHTTVLSYFFPEDPNIPNWRPFSMSNSYVLLLIGISLGLAIFQEWLCQYSLSLQKQTPALAILEFNDITELPLWGFFMWKYLPTMIIIFYAVLVSIMDFDVRRLEPYYQLSRPFGSKASHSLNLDHLTVFQYFVPVRAFKLRHATVFFSTIANIVASTVAPSLQNPSVAFVRNPICDPDSLLSNCGAADQPKNYFVRIQPIWSRAATASLGLTALLLMVIFVILLRRNSGLQSDPKGIAGIAAMVTKSHILNDFQDMDLATRGQIHKRLEHRRFLLYRSSIWQGQYDRDTEPLPRGDPKSPHPFMLRLKFGIPFILGLVFVLGSIPVISFTPARVLLNSAPWLPIALATTLKMIWTTLESDVRLIEPFYRLSKGHSRPQESLTLDYQSTVYGWMPIRALLNGHYLLVLVGISSVALDVLTVTISSLSVNSKDFLLKRKGTDNASNRDETRVSFFTSVVLSMAIVAFVICTASLVYAKRRHPFLPRPPSTIAAVLAFIYASKMLDDFVGTEHLNHRQIENRLKELNKRYSLGWFRGRDGKVHCAIDEEPRRSRYVHGKSCKGAQAPWKRDDTYV